MAEQDNNEKNTISKSPERVNKNSGKTKKGKSSNIFAKLFGIFFNKQKSSDNKKDKNAGISVNRVVLPVKKITNKEYEAIKLKIAKRLKEIPPDSRLQYDNLNKGNILILYKVLTDKKWFENDGIKNTLKYVMPDTDTQKSAHGKIVILNRFLNDKNWQDSKTVANSLVSILSGVDSPEAAGARIYFTNVYIRDEAIFANNKTDADFSSIVYGIYNLESAKGKLLLMHKLCKDENWRNSEAITSKFLYLLMNTNSEKSARARIEMLDGFLRNVFNNKVSEKKLLDLIRLGNFEEDSEANRH